MMILFCYSVHDKAAEAFLPPFYVRSKGEAIRSFTAAVNDPKHQFHASKGDYTLYLNGQFDDRSGVFGAVEPERVMSGLEVVVAE